MALAAEISDRGAKCVGLSRKNDGLDIRHAASIDAALAKVGDGFDTVIIATGVLAIDGRQPEKSLSAITSDQMAEVMAVNAIGPAMLLSKLPPLLAEQPRIGVLSARVGSIGDNRIGGWHSYRASKAALNQIVRGAAIELSRTHKGSVCVALHPGTIATPFTKPYAGRHKSTPAPDAAQNLLNVLIGLGPEQSGGFFDYAGNEVPW